MISNRIDAATLYELITNFTYSKEEYKGYVVVDNILTSSDNEDGDGHYDLIIKDVAENRFYEVSYSDWDIENTDYDEETCTIGERCDLYTNLTEVVPRLKTITVYEPIKK